MGVCFKTNKHFTCIKFEIESALIENESRLHISTGKTKKNTWHIKSLYHIKNTSFQNFIYLLIV